MPHQNSTNPSQTETLLAGIERDQEGFLLNVDDWTPELIKPLADEVNITMTDEHHHIVNFVRQHFEENHSVPEARTLLKHLKSTWPKDKATRRYLYTLFPYGYGQQACLIAGMRKPLKLMLDI